MKRMDSLKSSRKSKTWWAGIVALVLVAVFLFYWFELRPIRLYRMCANQASMDARNLLKSKADIAAGTDRGTAYAALAAKNMYLRSDYQSFLQKCTLHYGLVMPIGDISQEEPATEPDAN